MSTRPLLKNGNSLLTVVFIAVLTAFVSGCGGGTKTGASGSGATVQSGASAATAATAATGGSGATGATGATAATGGQSAQTGGTPSPAAGDEQSARTPVVITVENGAFANKTPKLVHVPPFIAIELDAGVRDPHTYKLEILREGAAKTQTKTINPGYTTIQLEGLRPGKTLTVALGARHVVVVADAAPGP
jgi:hypothetical protein